MKDRDDLLLMYSAQIALLEQLVRLLFRERAIKNKQGLPEIMQYGEDVKRFFESQLGNPEAESMMIGVVDRFFTNLASDVQSEVVRENRTGL